MANANTPFGLSPVGYLSGAPWNGKARRYYVASGEANALAIGDPVTLSGTADAAGVAGVTLATPGSGFLGVIVGMGGLKYGGPGGDLDNLAITVIPATKTKAYYVMVADDPFIIFEGQEIGTGTQLAATEVGLNVNMVAGTNNGYVSGWLITNTTEATTNTLDVKLLGLAQKPFNDFGAYAKWLVLINNHVYRTGVTGI